MSQNSDTPKKRRGRPPDSERLPRLEAEAKARAKAESEGKLYDPAPMAKTANMPGGTAKYWERENNRRRKQNQKRQEEVAANAGLRRAVEEALLYVSPEDDLYIDPKTLRADQMEDYQRLLAAERLLKSREAQDDLIKFAELLMPSVEDPLTVQRTRYEAQPFHRAIASVLQEVEKGNIKRLILTIPPRHGKTRLTSNLFPAWYIGRNPYKSVLFATYSQTFAEDQGREVRAYLQSPIFRPIFEPVSLRKGSTASDRMQVEVMKPGSMSATPGGSLFFVGRGGAITGRGGDLIIVDDPLKDREEADSELIRKKLWDWFNDTLMTRQMSDNASVVIIQCMTGDTPVLLPDGAEKPLKDIRVGDRVATYREGTLSEARVLNWKSNGVDSVLKIKMTSGSVVRANERHPFLVYTAKGPEWVRVKDLRRGQEIYRVNGGNGKVRLAKQKGAVDRSSAEDIASPTTIRNAGLTEFVRRLRVKIHHLVSVRNLSIGTGLLSTDTWSTCGNKEEHAQFVSVRQKMPGTQNIGSTCCVSITAMKPTRLGGFSATIVTWLSGVGRLLKSLKPQRDTSEFILDEIVSIEPDGREEVFDVQIEETENFIANGLVSHNTRWHEDDLVGRLTDPSNPHYHPESAAEWKIVNIPAVAEQNDILKRQPGEALWPTRFSEEYLSSYKKRNPRGFNALYQQRPTPEDGDFFTRDMIVEYAPEQLPDRLRIYAASDHAVSLKQDADCNVFLIVGVDQDDNIWLLDCYWSHREKTDVLVDKMIDLMEKYNPLYWWAASDHISKAIGPFLTKRMRERKVYVSVRESSERGDKQQKAQAIQGRMSQKMVRFPRQAPWFENAVSQLLKFPFGANDDFVDALSHIGRGLKTIVRPGPPKNVKNNLTVPPVGTFAWMKRDSDYRNGRRQSDESLRGM